MDDNNRINRRTRPRPYDLRRKVLLKNFLRDQMTHIPGTRMEIVSQNNIASSSEESFIPNRIEDVTEINENSPSSSAVDVQSCSILSNDDNNNTLNADLMSTDATVLTDSVDVETIDSTPLNSSGRCSQESPLVRIGSLLSFKRKSKRTPKSALLAKKVCKSSIKTRSFKSSFEKVFYGRKKHCESSSSSQVSRNSSRSLFSLFRQRKEQKHVKEADKANRSCVNNTSTSVSTKSSTLNQSVQTDDSWVRNEIVRVQQSNKRLKEENKLLSQSLSYFMSNASSDPQVRHCTTPLQSSNKNENSLIFHDYCVSSSNRGRDNWSSRSRVSRSKSYHEYNDRRNMTRNNYRTRSMNVHNNQNNISNAAKPTVSNYNEVISIPRVRRKSLLTVPISYSSRSIQRRSSMPERPRFENDRSLTCRRSGSLRESHNRTPFYALPSDAFY